MDRSITYGLHKYELKLKHILEVEHGLSCNCVCVGCGQDLVACCNKKDKDGNVIKYLPKPYFKHDSGKECASAYESTLHLLAKTVLQKTKKIRTPDYHYDYKPLNAKSFFKEGREITFENVVIEKLIIFQGKEIKPDVIGEIRNNKVFIEFAKTHFIDNEKREKLLLISEACIEIDINNLPLNEDTIRAFLISNTHLKYWITYPQLDKKYSEILEKRRKDVEENEKQARKKKQEEWLEREQKLNDYRNHDAYKLLQFENEELTNCPLIRQNFDNFKKTKLYEHPIIKKILNGTKWNKILYQEKDGSCIIFLDNEKKSIYPPYDAQERLNKEKMKQYDALFFYLNEIKRNLKKPNPYDCKHCQFYVDQINHGSNTFQVCKYPLR